MEAHQQQVRTISKKRKFVADGVFQAELNDFLQRALQQDGYAGIEVIVTSVNTEVRIKATRISEVLGKYGRRIRELTSLVQKRFNYPKEAIELLAQKVAKRGLCASVQAESLRYKLLGSVPVRMAANSIVRQVMLAGAKGVEVTVSGKLRAQRAKTMKFRDGYMISTGQPKDIFVDESVRHVNLRQGTLGVKVKILLPHDPTGAFGPKQRMPDNVDIVEPKEYTAVGNL